jgi:hypothetical protein
MLALSNFGSRLVSFVICHAILSTGCSLGGSTEPFRAAKDAADGVAQAWAMGSGRSPEMTPATRAIPTATWPIRG